MTPLLQAQVATLGKGHNLMNNNGLQIWGLDTGANAFKYSTLTDANFNGVMWSWGVDPAPHPKLTSLSAGQKWGKWTDPNGNPALALDATETSRKADLIALQVGDEQQTDIENPNGVTKTWFQNAHANNYFPNQLLYVNSFYINSDAAYGNFITSANPDAISFDAYPFNQPYGRLMLPHNWLSLAGRFRRHGLGNYIGLSNNSPRPYGLYLQTYESTSEGARHPGDVEMRWQQFAAWTMGYTFVDAFTVGGATSLFVGGNHDVPSEPRYSQFKESARQSRNIGPALVKLISYGYGPSIVVGKNSAGTSNPVPGDWLPFSRTNAPPSQQYLTNVGATNVGTKNGGQPGDVYVGFFNPLHASFGNPAGTTYFMVMNGLGAYLDDPTATVEQCMQQISLDFDFGTTTINSLQRLRRSDGQLEVIPLNLESTTGTTWKYTFNLEGGTGDLFKFNDGTPFVGIETPMATVYWDNDGIAAGNNTSTGAGMGGSGNWDTISSKWYNGSSNSAWMSNRNPVFWGTAGDINIVSPPSVDSLTFKTNGYTINGSSLTMNRPFITVDAGVTATINSNVGGSRGITKSGGGTLKLTGSNSFVGTTIKGGAVQVTSDAALGAVPASLRTNIALDGGTLQWGANFDLSNTRAIAIGPDGGTIDTQGFSNPGGYNATAGGFRGPGNLTKIGSGTFFASAGTGGANTSWKGRLIIKEGTWKIIASDGLPYNVPAADGLQPAQVTLDGGTWQTASSMSITNDRRGITIAAGGGTIDTMGSSFTWAGPMAGTTTTSVLTKIGSGLLRFTGVDTASTYNGIVNVSAGTLRLDNGKTMGDLASVNLTGVTGVLDITGNETIGSLGGSVGTVTLSPITLTTGGNNSSTTFGGVISGSGGINKMGSGTMTLAGSNTYTGATTITAGTLSAATSANLGGGGTNNSLVFAGGTLKATGPITTSRTFTVNAGNSTIDAAGTTVTFNGTGAGTINGNLTVAGGTLSLARTGGTVSNAAAAVVTVNPSATLNLAGSAAALAGADVVNNGALSVTAGNHSLDNLDGSGQTTVDSSLTVDRIRQGVLNVNGTAALRAGMPAGASRVTTISTAPLAAGGKLNLSDGRMITRSAVGEWSDTSYTGISGLIQSGQNDGAWDGPGINTSFPMIGRATATIGIATAVEALLLEPGETGIWSGQSVNELDVLLMYTYAGDANLDGRIDADDYSIIDTNYRSTAPRSYSRGDFNYDGNIDADDYSIIDVNVNQQRAPFLTRPSDDASATALVTVPEPTSGVLALLALSIGCSRRRRRASARPA